MSYCFIISTNQNFIDTISKFVEDKSYFNSVKVKIRDNKYSNSIDLFKCLSDKFLGIPFSKLREAVVLVDEYFNLHECQPIMHKVDSNIFWGRMILAFPELEFIFLNKKLDDSKTIIDWILNENSHEKKDPFVTIFDYDGIRNNLRKNINNSSKTKDIPSGNTNLFVRKKKARVIEDEPSYAYFHGYIAYKNFYITKLYTSLNHLKQVNDKLKKNNLDKKYETNQYSIVEVESVNLQIQDLSLGFVDKDSQTHLSDLSNRYGTDGFPFLRNVDPGKDFAITMGQDIIKVKARKLYIKFTGKTFPIVGRFSGKNSIILREKNDAIYFKINKQITESEICEYCGLISHELDYKLELIYKPTKGMFDIERQIGLYSDKYEQRIGNFNSHSAPGILNLIAEHLVSRSQNILDNAVSITDAIHSAVLALEAKELLNGLTPTLALQALSLQHRAEVKAECLFMGVEYNMNVQDRFLAIEKEVDIIAHYFKKEAKKQKLNAKLRIVEVLSGVFNDHKQFEEELECLNEARKIHFKVNYPILLPLNYSLKSIRHFSLVVFVTQMIFSGWYYYLAKEFSNLNPREFKEIFEISLNEYLDYLNLFAQSTLASFKYFFTTESPNNFDEVFKLFKHQSKFLQTFQGITSYTSLTILMAIIVTKLTRR